MLLLLKCQYNNKNINVYVFMSFGNMVYVPVEALWHGLASAEVPGEA